MLDNGKMKYLVGTICAKFFDNNFVDVWFLYCKVKESDGV